MCKIIKGHARLLTWPMRIMLAVISGPSDLLHSSLGSIVSMVSLVSIVIMSQLHDVTISQSTLNEENVKSWTKQSK